MDLPAPAHYVARTMELLLALLSLLTAATGALGGARAPEAGVHQAAQVAVAQQTAPRAVPVQRPAIEAQSRPESRDAVQPGNRAPERSVPLYADRLTE